MTAASDWDAPAERKIVRPALDGSYEALFHELGGRNFMLDLRDDASRSRAPWTSRALQRAIGVIYRPETERASHYFHAAPAAAVRRACCTTTSRARSSRSSARGVDEEARLPETFPSAL